MAATLSKLTLTQTQLQASYQLIAGMSGLSLVKFLAGRLSSRELPEIAASLSLNRAAARMPAGPQKGGGMRNTLDTQGKTPCP